MKRWLLALSLILPLAIIGLIFSRWPDGRLHVIVCDVGQGDAILVSYGFQQMLIDGGRDEKILRCLDRHLPIGDRTIEIVVATHADADHIGGLVSVFKYFNVREIVTTNQGKKTTDFAEFWRLVQAKEKQGTRLIQPKQTVVLWQQRPLWVKTLPTSGSNQPKKTIKYSFSETRLSAHLAANSQQVVDYNNGSIVLLLQFGQRSFLFTGDLEKEGELSLIRRGLLKKVDVLKVGHHGSKSSSSQLFLAKIRPEISLISVGKNNHYGHPSPQVIDRLKQINSKIYRTDLVSTIEVSSDGQKLFVKTGR